jgi:hypothetical protein
VHAAAAAPASRQRDVERFLGKARGQLGVGELAPARLERRLDALLGGVEFGAERLALFRRK